MKDSIIQFPKLIDEEIEKEEPVFVCTESIFKSYRQTYFLLGFSAAAGSIAVVLELLNMFFGNH